MTQTKLSIGLVALAALITLAGLVAAPSPEPDMHREPQPFDAGLARAYVEAGCWQCHTVSTLEAELRETFGTQAAGLSMMGPDLAGVGTRFHPDWHAAHFYRPEAAYAGSQMPAHRELIEGDGLSARGRKVVDFLLTLTAPSGHVKPWPVDRKPAPVGDAGRGAELFRRECAGCHGKDGDGNGELARFFRVTRKPPALRVDPLIHQPQGESKADAIFNTMTNGLPGTGMPAFAHRLSEQDRADIAAWLARS